MAAMINNRMGKRKKEQDDDDDDDNVSLSHSKKPRLVWSPHLHSKFLHAVHLLGLHEAVPRKIVALMNVEGITREHVASHLQKYRLSKKKAIHIHQQDDTLPSTMILNPTQSQTSFTIHPQSQTQTSFTIHPQSYNFPVNQTSTLLLPIMSGVGPSTLIPPIQYQSSSLFPAVLNQSATPFDFHDSMATNCPPLLQMNSHDLVGSASSSKSTSIWDYDWHTNYMKSEPQLLQFPNNYLPVLESDKTSENSQMQTHNVEPFIVGSAASLEDTNIKDYNFCYDNSPVGFSVEETNSKTSDWGCLEQEDLTNMWGSLEQEDFMNVWKCLEEEEDATNAIQPLCYEAPQQTY
ncbi:unnamed protein product [Lathyrus oleraceus]